MIVSITGESPRRRARLIGRLILVAMAPLLAAGCGEGAGQQDPQKFYEELVKAAREKNGGYMYDVLDSSRKSEIDTLIGMQLTNLDALPASERPMWDSLKGKSKRDIYGKVLESDPGVAKLFEGDYKILKVDTFVIVTVQHTGEEPNIMYLRPRGGKYLVSRPPRLPDPPMPAGHPPVESPHGAMPPGGGGGATQGGPSDAGNGGAERK